MRDVSDDVRRALYASHVSNWNMWQQFIKVENLLSGMMESYEFWRQ